MNDISPRQLLEHALRFWWVIAGCMLLGGCAAWVFSLFHTPVYEATALYDASVDTDQLAQELNVSPSQVPMDFTSQNDLLTPVEDIFYLPEVVNQLVASAKGEGISLTEKDFFTSNTFYIDRKGARWLISVRRTDPNSATQLANLWVTTADAVIREALPHSVHALALQSQRTLIQKCFSGSDFAQANQCAGTSIASSSDLDTTLTNLEQQILSEEQAGRKIDPAVQVAFIQPAKLPTHPVLNNPFLMIMAGALIGVLIGVLLVQRLPVLRPSLP